MRPLMRLVKWIVLAVSLLGVACNATSPGVAAPRVPPAWTHVRAAPVGFDLECITTFGPMLLLCLGERTDGCYGDYGPSVCIEGRVVDGAFEFCPREPR